MPAIGVGIILGIYSVYWYVAAGKLRAGIENFAAEPHPGDIAAGWSALSISGYPYRIAVTLTDPVATAPQTPEDWSWQASSLEADFLPYDLRHVVLKVDGEQVLRYRDVGGSRPLHTVRATAVGTWASYVDVKDAPFGRLAIDIDNLVAVRDGREATKPGKPGERFAAGRLQLHMRPSEDNTPSASAPVLASEAGSYDIALQGNDMAIDRASTLRALGSEIDLIAVQARLRNVPKNTGASLVELSRDWLQQGGSLAVSDLQVKWGPLNMWAQGEMTLDEKARPKGTFDAEITNYPGLLSALVKAGVINERDANLALVGMGLLAQLQGTPEGRLRVPVVMNEGKLYLGPIVVAKLDPVY
ncbi:MAG: DUF2125 domain-containing protein [Parvibaculum sp.]|uniref:DUF2125 domain-containing protein n=1 Tax=Parvibaculum sp. TaxID=2024848 RepID=UPI0025F3CB79|nr:DUF2125 domain-containing protein [Parvibaculum sp.]MCE9648575.1 DUF2125 domain-containing protein [Parvibaculum sp.]